MHSNNMNSQSQNKVEHLPDEFTNTEISYKVIIIGNSGVGKSCLSGKAKQNEYDENTISTIGFEHYSLNFKYKTKCIKLSIWDNSGNEQYKQLISSFYGNAGGAVIVYSINDKASFEAVKEWIQNYRAVAAEDCKTFGIGNKTDLEEEREVEFDDAVKLKEEYKMDLFLETSAKTGYNALEIFMNAVQMLYDSNNLFENPKRRVEDMHVEDAKTDGNRGNEDSGKKSAFRMFFHNGKEDTKKQIDTMKNKKDDPSVKPGVNAEGGDSGNQKEEKEKVKAQAQTSMPTSTPEPQPVKEKSAFRMFFHNGKEDAKKTYSKIFEKDSDQTNKNLEPKKEDGCVKEGGDGPTEKEKNNQRGDAEDNKGNIK